MAFLKKIWKKGDKITSAALNRIEDALDALATAYIPLEAEGTLVIDEQTGKTTITLNKTAGELYEAACAGKLLKLSIHITETIKDTGEDYVIDVTRVTPFVATKMVAESLSAVAYNFEVRIGDHDGDSLLYSGDLAETDTVVLTEV